MARLGAEVSEIHLEGAEEAHGRVMPMVWADLGLPIGIQLHGRRWQEGLLLRAGAAYQTATHWYTRRRPLLDA